jgi:hypothetical protein
MGYHDEEKAQEEREIKKLKNMSIEQLKAELDERMKACLIEEIQKLPERIDRHLDEAAWKIISTSMGVKRDSWHDSKWEIDTHYKGAALAVALGEHALKQVQMAIPGFIEGLVVGDPKTKGVKAAYERSYKEHLAELLNNKVWEVAQSNAKKRFVEIMEKLSGEPVDVEDEEDAA